VSDRGSHLAWELDAQARVRRAAARQRRRRCALLTLAVITALALVAGGAWAFWLRDDEQRARRAVVLPPDITLGPRPEFDSGASCREPLVPDDPLRLWIGGDSLAGTLGPALGEQAAETGVVLPTYDYRTSSGLASPSFFDWPEHASEEMDRVDPEVVVFIIGANDSGVARDEPLDDAGQPAWRAFYGGLVDEMLDIFTGEDRAVFWVGSPTLRDAHKDGGVRQVNDVAKDVIRRRPDVTFIDAYDLFSDDDGEYAATLPGVDGDDVRVRTNDGIHFTPAGGDLLGAYVLAYLDERCDVTSQAVPNRRQPVRQSPGSGTVPGSDDREPGTTAPPPPPTTTTLPPSTTTTPPTVLPPLDSLL
jgi:hypothetical protein